MTTSGDQPQGIPRDLAATALPPGQMWYTVTVGPLDPGTELGQDSLESFRAQLADAVASLGSANRLQARLEAGP